MLQFIRRWGKEFVTVKELGVKLSFIDDWWSLFDSNIAVFDKLIYNTHSLHTVFQQLDLF